MKLTRLLSILLYLLQHKKVSAEEFAQRFEVSTRTIYRDMDALGEAGIPIFSFLGKQGGFSLMETFRLDQFTFDNVEKQQLLEALIIQKQLMEPQQTVVQQKLELLYAQPHKPVISVQSSTLHREEIEQLTKNKIGHILRVIEQKYKLQIAYISAEAISTERIIYPRFLHFQQGSWYVEAFCEMRQAQRFFKLTRIKKWTVIPEIAAPIIPTDSSVEVEQQQIKLRFAASELGKLHDFFTEDEWHVAADGSIDVTFSVAVSKDLVPFLLMFGSRVTILSPANLQQAYQKELQKMMQS